MGLIEFHLHEPDFDFSPSMSTGGSKKDDESTMTDDESLMGTEQSDLDTEWSADDSKSSRGPGKLAGLAMLIGLGVLMAWRRRSKGTGQEETLDTEDEVEVYS